MSPSPPGPHEVTIQPAPAPGRPRPSFQALLRRFPVTFGLTGVTCAFFFLEWLLGGTTDLRAQMRLGALRGDLVFDRGEWYRLFCAVFLHHSIVHFGMNWFAFLQLGALVEQLYGSARLLAFYLLCGLGSSLLSATMLREMGGSLGASGAIMGLAGLLVGASWFAPPAARARLRRILGRRLLIGVILTFVVGVAIYVFALPIIDNWGHLGGCLTGVVLSLVQRRPERTPSRIARAAAGGLAGVTLFAFFAMAGTGGRALETFDRDLAGIFVRRVEAEPNGYLAGGALGEMIKHYQQAGDPEAACDVLRRVLPRVEDPEGLDVTLSIVQESSLLRESPPEEALELVTARWLELSPRDPKALNSLAWLLLTRREPARREPERARTLLRRCFAALRDSEVPRELYFSAACLDTFAECLYQLDDLRGALRMQRAAVALLAAEPRGLLELMGLEDRTAMRTELAKRLEKIEAALGLSPERP